jgi:hypothetical protein
MGFAWKEEKLPGDSSSWLRIICSPQVLDKATISYVASSKKMMLAANSANHGDNKVAGSGAGAIFDQNEVPKPGPQNRQFCGNPWGVPPHYIYIYNQHNLTNLTHIPAAGIPVVGKGMTSVTQLRWFAALL